MASVMLEGRAGSNQRLLRKLIIIAVAMFGFAWGMIPLYRIVCEATGINRVETPDPVPLAGPDVQASATALTMQFDAMVQAGLPWQIKPLTGTLSVRPGRFVQVVYEITNMSGQPVTGQAIPHYLPGEAAAYVHKLECFCFSQQRFRPGETRRFPVVFVVDPHIPSAIRQITLSYSVFDVPTGPG